MDNIDEQWIDLGPKPHKRDRVAISNTGKYKRADGSSGILSLRSHVKCDGKKEWCSHIIAEQFLITVRRPDQTIVDHITHYPNEYNVNDVRNLRWCTKAENSGFEEARENRSISMKGKFLGEKNPMYGRKGKECPMYGNGDRITGDKNPNWKGDNVGTQMVYVRAKKLYKAGKITEEEFQPYRDGWSEYKRAKKKQTGVQREGCLMEKE